MAYLTLIKNLNLLNISSDSTIVIPSKYYIVDIIIENTTANAVTGGIKIGSTNGGVDVVVSLAIGSNALFTIPDATILKKVFSNSIDTTLFIQTLTLWNSANVNFTFVLRRIV